MLCVIIKRQTMEYIKSKLQLQIQYLETANDKEAQRELCEFYRIRIEYNLLFLLGYLWNKNRVVTF
ncbi:MAG: hypothetical protein OHK0053_36350 [Microscillaceae bacterium]